MTGNDAADRTGTITKLSPCPVDETVSRLTAMITEKGMKLFAVIDQSAEATAAGLQLRATTLVIFGNPAAGTPVMEASPLAGRGIATDDLPYENSYVWIMRLHEGKVIDGTAFYDSISFNDLWARVQPR